MGRPLNIIFHCFLLSLIHIVSSTEFVPVFMWETNNAPEPIPALHKVSEDSFKDSLLDLLKKNPYVVVFAEHTLSPEDFAQKNRAGEIAYKNFLNLKKSYKVTYRPYVQNPIRAVKQLDRKVTEISITSLLQNNNVPKDNILIVDLNDAKDDEHRFDMLKRHDATIMSIYNELLQEHDKNVLAIYTAHHTSWVASEEITHRRSRSLLAEDDEASGQTNDTVFKFYKDDNIFVALTGDITVMAHDKNETIGMETVTMTSKAGNSSSGNEYVIMTLHGGQLDIETNFTSLGSSGYWKVTEVKVTYPGMEFVNATNPNIVVPTTFSYHCGNAMFKYENSNVTIPGYQVFPIKFTSGNYSDTGRFPDSYDCVGFTSVPIWSGIFVTFILLFIMTFGLTMMMDIRTMDRFDDSKGKTITINASD